MRSFGPPNLSSCRSVPISTLDLSLFSTPSLYAGRIEVFSSQLIFSNEQQAARAVLFLLLHRHRHPSCAMQFITAVTLAYFILSSTVTALPALHDHSAPSPPSKSRFHKRFYSAKEIVSRTRSTFVHLVDPPKVALTRLAIRDEDNSHFHPLMLFAQHHNRGLRRHALMTGRAIPTDEDLENNLRKRWMALTGDTLEQSHQRLRLRKRQRLGGPASGSAGDEVANSFIGEPGSIPDRSATLWTPVGQSLAAAGGRSGGLANANGFPQQALTAALQNTVTNASTPTTTQSLGLNIEANNVGYFATIQMGTPPKDYRLLLDSGSADLWVPGDNCTSCGATHTTLGTASSSSFVGSTTPWTITFGTGTVSGTLAKENVEIAGLKLAAHPMGVTSTESVDFSAATVPFDGLMGLAKSELSTQKQPTPIESLAAQGVTTTSQMGFHLTRLTDGTSDGEATFGGVDSTKFTGNLVELANVSPVGFWEAAMSDIQVNGASLNLAGRTAILDTGTTLMIMPTADATAIHAAIPGSATDGKGGFAVPCNNTAVVSLAFNGTSFTINPTDLAFVPVNENDLNGLCISGIASGQVGSANEWLVGDTFLKNVYFATDVKNNLIGLAPALTAVPAVTGGAGTSAPAGAATRAPAGAATSAPAKAGTSAPAKGEKGQKAKGNAAKRSGEKEDGAIGNVVVKKGLAKGKAKKGKKGKPNRL